MTQGVRGGSNPGLDLHRVACNSKYTTNTVVKCGVQNAECGVFPVTLHSALRTLHSKGGRHGSRTHMTRRSHGLANRPGEPYPATFR